ncbi:MAG: DNA repair protein RecO [candidate division Zixibacteria bacterium]
MAQEKSQAILLKAHNWSESSRIVLFFTSDFGKLRLTDRGGRSLKSKRGRLMPFALLELTFYKSEKQSIGYLTDCDIQKVFSFEGEGSLGRLAYASAATELINLLLPEEEAQPYLFDYTVTFYNLVDTASKRALPALFIAYFLRLLSRLGYHPSLNYCAVSGDEFTKFASTTSTVNFSPAKGGIVSPPCQVASERYIALSPDCFQSLVTLQTASLTEAANRIVSFADAGQILFALSSFISYQAELKAGLNSLEFLDKLKRTHLKG